MKYIIAAVISLIGLSASYLFLRPKEWNSGNDAKRVAIALLKSEKSDVKKKWGSKVIWSDVAPGDTLYQGDIIQTQKMSAVIEFIKTKSSINIDPETTIVVEGVDENINLNVLEGGLFVKGDGGEQGNIQVQSRGQKVDIKSADASFSVGKDGGLDVKVHKGSVAASVGDKLVTLSDNEIANLSGKEIVKTKEKYKNIFPAYNQTVYISPSKKITSFKWTPLKNEKNTKLLIGPNKSLLTPVNKTSIIKKAKGLFMVKINVGQFYWKLVSNEDDPENKVESGIYKVDIKSLIPPSLTAPTDGEIKKFKTGNFQALEFTWFSSIKLNNTLIQISRDSSFSQIIFEKTSTQNKLKIKQIKNEGKYFWRIVGQLPNSLQKIKSKIQSFTVKFYDNIFAPKPINPKNNYSHIITQENQRTANIRFIWERVPLAKKYHILIEKSESESNFKYDKILTSPQIKLNGLKVGSYRWKISSIDKLGSESDFSKPYNFKIQLPEKISLINMKDEYEMVNESALIDLSWKNSRIKTNPTYKIRYSQKRNFRPTKEIEVTKENWKLKIKKEGQYFLRIYSLDKNRSIKSKSKIYKFDIIKKPLPQAPSFSSKHSSILKANKLGKIKIKFDTKLDKEDQIIVTIKNLKQDVIMNMSLKKNEGILHSLLPGRYWISGYIKDKYGRNGATSESRTLIVPKKSTIRAPKIKRIKIR